MTTLNAIVAKQLRISKLKLMLIETKEMKKDDAIFNVLREYIKHSKKILLKETVTVKHGRRKLKKRFKT
jgi:glutamine synthetase